MPDFDEYFGCECMCLHHVVYFCYFKPCDDCEPEEDVIYFTCHSSQWRDRFLPDFLDSPLKAQFWKNYWNTCILNRVFIAFKYIFNNDIPEAGTLDGMDFQKKDLDRLDKILTHLETVDRNDISQDNVPWESWTDLPKKLRNEFESEMQRNNEMLNNGEIKSVELIDHSTDDSVSCNQNFNFLIKDHIGRWNVIFDINRLDEDFPYELGWNIDFIPRKFFGRLWNGLKYIFNCNGYIDELNFEINKENAIKLKGMINFVRKQDEIKNA
ncbi:MAG: hypothetical protein KR126chlam6_01508 [Candidatus Anoxychlamydiales bacterium]|nr:hypothetical protein [Candidatus Anoxychlamydiales bacterium]